MIGRTLTHYEITGLLGQGGMGEVYRARDTKLDREVALKILPADMADEPTRLARFTREARTVAGLNHPNIVTLHSVDEAEGIPFITMELVSGRTLGEITPEHGLAVDRLIEIACEVADALATAHDRGIIHRDLKPGNVMVTNETGRVKVLDFGLAKLNLPEADQDSESSHTMTMTSPGVLLGTPWYMSPEQARNEEVDARSDIFSLGVMMYEMASGQRPFQGQSTIELLTAVLRDDPAPLGDRRRGVPPGLVAVIERCLAKQPDRRYTGARELLADLRALQTGSRLSDATLELPASGPGHGPVAVSKAQMGRGSPGLWVLAAAVLVVAGVLFVRLGGGGAADTAAGSVVAVLPFENLGQESEEYFAAGITDEITSRLAVLEGMAVISRTSARVYAGTEKPIRVIGEELGADYILEGSIRWDGVAGRMRISPRLIRVANDTQVWTDSYDREVTEVFALQAEIAARIADALDVTILDRERQAINSRPTENMAAYQAYLQGMRQLRAPGFGRESFELGVQMFERAVAADPEFALAWARLGSMNARMIHYGYDRSEARQNRSWEAAEKALALEPDLAEAHLSLGQYYYWAGRDFPRALAALEAATELAPNLGEALLTIAYVQRRQGLFEASLASFERYRNLSPLDPNVFVGLGETLATLRRYEQAEPNYRRAIELEPGDPYPYTEAALLHMRWKGDAAAARAVLETAPPDGSGESCRVGYLVELLARRYDAALARLENCGQEELQAGAFYLPLDLMRGMALRLSGKGEQAEAALSRAAAVLEDLVAGSPEDHRFQAALGLTYAGMGQREAALRCGRRAVEIDSLAEDALGAPVPLINLALIHATLGQAGPAVEVLEEVLSIPSILSVAWLKTDPRWDPIREAAEFQTLLARHAGRYQD